VLAVLAGAAPAGALPTAPWVVVSGNHFLDTRTGQPVVLRGFDVPIGMTGATQAVALGANMVRIPVPWSSIEPNAPVNGIHHWDQAKLSALDAEVAYLQQHGVEVLIDFHQVHWSPYFASVCQPGTAACGSAQGIPAWYYADGRFPNNLDGVTGAEAAFFSTEFEQSVAAYSAFAQMMAARYSVYPNVVGYEVLNEPQGGALALSMGLHQMTATMLQWQSLVLNAIREVDPTRAAFISCRGGGEGVGTADLSVFHHDPHLVLDFHDFFNGISTGGFDIIGDNWVPSWKATHNQFVTDYQGTLASQQRVLMVAVRRAAAAGIPLFVGEWGARWDDANAAVFQQQLLTLFDRYGVSWTRWILNSTDRFRLIQGGDPTAQALQVSAALAVPPTVTSFEDLPLLAISSLTATPKPLRTSTSIRYVLTRPGTVTVSVLHLQGRVARHLPPHGYPAGGVRARVLWRRVNDAGGLVTAGLYVIQVDATDSRGEHVRRSLLVRVLPKLPPAA
jgi:Cellulase (glycosyl hydrolase family 5)